MSKFIIYLEFFNIDAEELIKIENKLKISNKNYGSHKILPPFIYIYEHSGDSHTAETLRDFFQDEISKISKNNLGHSIMVIKYTDFSFDGLDDVI